MVKAVFDELKKAMPKDGFTVGIDDDVSFSSLSYDAAFDTEDPKTVRCLFYGLGSNDDDQRQQKLPSKSSAAKQTSRATTAMTPKNPEASQWPPPLRSQPPRLASYMINKANFIACHSLQLP